MTRAELKTLIRELLSDLKGKAFSTERLDEAIEYAISSYCEKTGASYQELDATIDQEFIDTPGRCLRVVRILSSTLGELDETTITDETTRRQGWRADAPGEPTKWMLFNALKIRIHPAPDATERTFQVGYIEAPDPIVDDADPITSWVRNSHQRLLRYAAAAWLLTDQGDEEDQNRAQAYMQIFNSSIGV